jgi:hypothetical protein
VPSDAASTATTVKAAPDASSPTGATTYAVELGSD